LRTAALLFKSTKIDTPPATNATAPTAAPAIMPSEEGGAGGAGGLVVKIVWGGVGCATNIGAYSEKCVTNATALPEGAS
jgi:hypothetical protein